MGYKNSNHYSCKFSEAGVQYNSVEQYFMASKAKFFKDEDAEKEIMTHTDPAAQKRVRVKNFKQEEWRKNCMQYMKNGLNLKFEQN